MNSRGANAYHERRLLPAFQRRASSSPTSNELELQAAQPRRADAFYKPGADPENKAGGFAQGSAVYRTDEERDQDEAARRQWRGDQLDMMREFGIYEGCRSCLIAGPCLRHDLFYAAAERASRSTQSGSAAHSYAPQREIGLRNSITFSNGPGFTSAAQQHAFPYQQQE
ncbi:hypothetical protein BAUCODRAFT_36118 [Baudoinia panamericana UAMH 10762]|uniref:Uncharacterized protein n=1 Tax=Baudoinia panamericana (strain UAMH 10762) TaxID=717646 RepID=M2ME32_BAUPA|nr:uncharacterized protein BAUCODRAFT_36118 [Baudoinia panamericana UAMH 10762]EMC94841.1 hypothetical protein BAUCODRAFT_36118 [Baudoinia panamericana UAMH 10762]